MTEHRMDAAEEAVEQLARSVGPVPPPRGLKAGPRRGLGAAAGVALLLAMAATVTWWMRSPATTPTPTPGPEPAGVVVEHLRIGGRSVQARVERVPEAGAVMVTMAEDADESSVPETGGEGS